MSRNARSLCVVALLALFIVGAAVAGNMTFKFVPSLIDQDPGIYKISLPLMNQYTDLASVFNDISGSAGCTAGGVSTFLPDQSSCTWNGPYSCNRPIVKGEGITVSVLGGPCTDWIIVGGHDLDFTYSFALSDPNIYEISVPLHTTAMALSDLCDDIPQCAAVTQFNPDQTSCTYNGFFSCDAPIKVGEAYRLSVNPAPSLPATWTPSHF